jgi:mRNA interferase RelE/StbE
MYEIVFANSAAKSLRKLPNDKQKHILAVLERARIRPGSFFERLVGEKAYKLRAGDYRIIAEIYRDRLVILVIKIGHRRDIYK